MTERAVLAGGCFWGMQELVRELPGVVDTRVGYAGGSQSDASYDDVKTGRTDHAESLLVVFDPATLSFEDLLAFFFQIHDPTTRNRQGNDRGSQYRSVIFAQNEEQKAKAAQVIKAADASGKWPAPVVTEVLGDMPFYDAEDYHQDYLQKHPHGYTCHYIRPEWALEPAAEAAKD